MPENSCNRSDNDQENNIKGNDSIIELSKVDARWSVSSSENGENTWTDISLKVQSGQLLTVAGNIGCGIRYTIYYSDFQGFCCKPLVIRALF